MSARTVELVAPFACTSGDLTLRLAVSDGGLFSYVGGRPSVSPTMLSRRGNVGEIGSEEPVGSPVSPFPVSPLGLTGNGEPPVGEPRPDSEEKTEVLPSIEADFEDSPSFASVGDTSGKTTLPERLETALIEQREAAMRLGELIDVLAPSDAEQRSIDDAILATHRIRGDRIVMACEPRDLEHRRALFERKTGLAIHWGRIRIERKAAKAHLGACEREVKDIRREIVREQEQTAKRTGRAR